jgi:hypothetical protein
MVEAAFGCYREIFIHDPIANVDRFYFLKECLTKRTLGGVMSVLRMVVVRRIFTWPVRIVTG